MNSNAFRSILNLLSGGAFISVAMSALGCTGDNPATAMIEPTTCGASWLPVEYQAVAGGVFVALGFMLKLFAGTGTVAQNIAAPIVPVVPPEKATVGVVTAAQVADPGPYKA